MKLIDDYNSVKSSIPKDVTLVAVSKTKPIEDIEALYDKGQRVFGENKIQELKEKHEALPKDIEWHMIGNIQTNKLKYIASFVSLVHSVDRIKVLKELNKLALKNNRIINVLLQVKISDEETKSGFLKEELLDILKNNELQNFKNIKVKGLMGMATNTTNKSIISDEFNQLKNLFNHLKNGFSLDWDIISMGMTSDYELALENGSNMIRIGSKIFGARNYNN